MQATVFIAMDKESKQLYRSLAQLSSIGLVMALCIAIGAFIGYYLDKKFGTEPVFLIIFFFLGVAAAFKNLYTLYKKTHEHEK